jgi:hypothetical protein
MERTGRSHPLRLAGCTSRVFAADIRFRNLTENADTALNFL